MDEADYGTEEETIVFWQYRLAFDGVDNTGKWFGRFREFAQAEAVGKLSARDLEEDYGFTPSVQYRRGTRTTTTKWEAQ
jgi:hypothetical protein